MKEILMSIAFTLQTALIVQQPVKPVYQHCEYVKLPEQKFELYPSPKLMPARKKTGEPHFIICDEPPKKYWKKGIPIFEKKQWKK